MIPEEWKEWVLPLALACILVYLIVKYTSQQEKISPETFGKTLKELQEDIGMENEAKKQ